MAQCLELFRETGSRWLACWAFAFLGRIKAHRGEITAAYPILEESLAEARALDDWPQAFCLKQVAVVEAAQGKHAKATRLLSVAESLHEKCGIPLTAWDRADYEPVIAAVRAPGRVGLYCHLG